MAEPMLNSHFQSLEIRMQRTQRSLKILLCLFLLLLCFSAYLVLRLKSIQAASPETLRVRKLVVLDDAGKERIVIAAPIPDPIVGGKNIKRRVAVGAGIQFKDPDGTERGGIASEDDGSFMFGIPRLRLLTKPARRWRNSRRTNSFSPKGVSRTNKDALVLDRWL